MKVKAKDLELEVDDLIKVLLHYYHEGSDKCETKTEP